MEVRLIRAVGFNLGLRGDLVMNTVAARSFKEIYPNSSLTLGVGPQFADMMPLFYHNPYFNDFYIYETYYNWPSKNDIEYLKWQNYDIVFNGKPEHRDEWWKFRHQYAEAANMNGLPIPKDINPVLTEWFDIENLGKTIAFAPFAGNNIVNDKALSQYKAQIIVKFINQLGFKVIHLGAPNEPEIFGAIKLNTNYFESVKKMLGCRFLIHTDTGLGHVAGAYNFPRLGLYSHRYYGKELLKNIIPLNKNSVNLDASNVNDIEDELIFAQIEEMIKNT